MRERCSAATKERAPRIFAHAQSRFSLRAARKSWHSRRASLLRVSCTDPPIACRPPHPCIPARQARVPWPRFSISHRSSPDKRASVSILTSGVETFFRCSSSPFLHPSQTHLLFGLSSLVPSLCAYRRRLLTPRALTRTTSPQYQAPTRLVLCPQKLLLKLHHGRSREPCPAGYSLCRGRWPGLVWLSGEFLPPYRSPPVQSPIVRKRATWLLQVSHS